MTREQIKTTVTKYLQTLAPSHTFRDDENIFARGFVNSLESVQLVLFLEKEYSISVAQSERKLDNFCTLDGIATFVLRKLG